MKTKVFLFRFLLIGFSILPVLRSEETRLTDAFSSWMSHYYQTQEISEFGRYWDEVINLRMLTKKNRIQPMLGFFNRVLHQHPELLDNSFDDFKRFPVEQKDAIARLLWLSDTPEARRILRAEGYQSLVDQVVPSIDSWKIEQAQDLDFCWGWFSATENTAALKPIVATLDLGKYAGALKRYKNSKRTEADRQAAEKDAVFGAAVWSLMSNGKTNPRVAKFLEKEFQDPATPRSRKRWLVLMLKDLFPEKYEVKNTPEDDAAPELAIIDESLAEVGRYALNYPPKFASKKERKKTEAMLRRTIVELDTLLKKSPDNEEVLLRTGRAHSMGHNLDFKGSTERCGGIFDHLLGLNPDSAQANLHYGVFLAGAGRQQQGISYLLTALDLGAEDAHYPLAIAYLTLKDTSNAASHLRSYLSIHPGDSNARGLLEVIESDNLTFKQMN